MGDYPGLSRGSKLITWVFQLGSNRWGYFYERMVRGNIAGFEEAGKNKKIGSCLEPPDTLTLA